MKRLLIQKSVIAGSYIVLALLLEIINTKPVHDKAEYDRIWDETIEPLTDAYIINDDTRYSTAW